MFSKYLCQLKGNKKWFHSLDKSEVLIQIKNRSELKLSQIINKNQITPKEEIPAPKLLIKFQKE